MAKPLGKALGMFFNFVCISRYRSGFGFVWLNNNQVLTVLTRTRPAIFCEYD